MAVWQHPIVTVCPCSVWSLETTYIDTWVDLSDSHVCISASSIKVCVKPHGTHKTCAVGVFSLPSSHSAPVQKHGPYPEGNGTASATAAFAVYPCPSKM